MNSTSTSPFPSELLNHPLIKQATDDINESRAKLQTERFVEQATAQQERHELVTGLRNEYKDALDTYERRRLELHEALGHLWAAVEAHSRLTGSPPPGFPELVFHNINIPTLKPQTSPWSSVNGPFTTTRAAVDGWFATHGKTWPLQG